MGISPIISLSANDDEDNRSHYQQAANRSAPRTSAHQFLIQPSELFIITVPFSAHFESIGYPAKYCRTLATI
jgi:hypothetical protein